MVDIAWQPGQDTLGLFFAAVLRKACRLRGPVNLFNEEPRVGAVKLAGRPRKIRYSLPCDTSSQTRSREVSRTVSGCIRASMSATA